MTTETAESAVGTVYVFCPEEPELRIFLPASEGVERRRVKFLNGRLDSVTHNLNAADISYFENIMEKDILAGADPTFIVWTGDIRDPNLRVLVEHRVAKVIMNSATAQVGPNIMNTVAIRLAAMLAQPGQISGRELSNETRELMLNQMTRNRPSTGLGNPNARSEAEAAQRIEAQMAREQQQVLADEQKMINAAAESMGGDQAPASFPDLGGHSRPAPQAEFVSEYDEESEPKSSATLATPTFN